MRLQQSLGIETKETYTYAQELGALNSGQFPDTIYDEKHD